MTQELIDYHKNKMLLAEAEGRTEDYKFHNAAIEMLSQPTLPSNLDEAANKFAVLYDQGTCDGIVQDCFKAGAEWMAGLGVKIGETKIYLEDDGDEPPYTQEWLDLESTEFKIPDGAFKDGDEVEVILRKK